MFDLINRVRLNKVIATGQVPGLVTNRAYDITNYYAIYSNRLEKRIQYFQLFQKRKSQSRATENSHLLFNSNKNKF